jgi:hypothetical protein
MIHLMNLTVDFDHRGRFRPLDEFVNDDVDISVPSDGLGKWPQNTQPHTTNDYEGGIICSVCADVWICLT